MASKCFKDNLAASCEPSSLLEIKPGPQVEVSTPEKFSDVATGYHGEAGVAAVPVVADCRQLPPPPAPQG